MVRAQRRKYHYIYKTTCKITEKYYYGMHSTSNLEDGYIGSGKMLWHSIRKYGIQNHIKEIIEYLPNREELKKREAQIVNEELILNTKCMNLQLGGGGGLSSEEHSSKFHKAGGRKVFQMLSKKHSDKLKNDIEYKEKYSQSLKNYYKSHSGSFTGKTHSIETKQQMSLSHQGKQTGEKNSNFGNIWVYNLELKKSKCISKYELNNYLSNNWIKGRKMNFKI